MQDLPLKPSEHIDYDGNCSALSQANNFCNTAMDTAMQSSFVESNLGAPIVKSENTKHQILL
jgi:hypothetical protein